MPAAWLFRHASFQIRHSFKAANPPIRHLSASATIAPSRSRYTTHPNNSSNPTIIYDLYTQRPAYLYIPSTVLRQISNTSTSIANPLSIKLYPDRPIHQTLLQLSTELDCTLPFHLSTTISTDTHCIVQHCRSNQTLDILQFALHNCARPNLTLSFNNRLNFEINLPTFLDRTRHLFTQLEVLAPKLLDLKTIKSDIETQAKVTADRLVWGGLAFLCAQWGLMARLTWWEYSWDVMEPISYFLTFGTGIIGYMFFVITRREYSFEVQTGLIRDIHASSLYAKRGLDLVKYDELNFQIREIKDCINRVSEDYNLPRFPL